MSEILIKLSVFALLIFYVVFCVRWQKPQTPAGKLARNLCLINVMSWVIILPLNDRGHPPPQVIAGFLLWLINVPLLIAIAVALVVAFKTGEENKPYLSVTSMYVLLNILLVCVLPIILLLLAG